MIIKSLIIGYENNRIYDEVEAETKKSQASFQIIWSYARLPEHST